MHMYTCENCDLADIRIGDTGRAELFCHAADRFVMHPPSVYLCDVYDWHSVKHLLNIMRLIIVEDATIEEVSANVLNDMFSRIAGGDTTLMIVSTDNYLADMAVEAAKRAGVQDIQISTDSMDDIIASKEAPDWSTLVVHKTIPRGLSKHHVVEGDVFFFDPDASTIFN